MFRIRRPAGLPAALVLAAASLVGASSAQAASASRVVLYDVPSLKGNIDVSKTVFNKTDKLRAFVRLPAGYDDQPGRRWPVLYLLHGWEDNADAWLDPAKGDINAILPADWPGIVVLPEGARGWTVNWYDEKKYPAQRWQDYLLDEVVPAMESELRIAPGRGNHAIGGLSMGGFGAVRAVMSMPTYFGHALSYSGLLDNQDLSFNGIINFAQFGGAGYDSIFGPVWGAYADAVNPAHNTRDLRGSRVSVTYGTPNPSFLLSLDVRVRAESTLEVGAQGEARSFLSALKGKGVAVFENNRPGGAHSWPSWRLDFADAVKRGIFQAPPITETRQATTWDYDTMSTHGNAWGIGFQTATRPTTKMTLSRRDGILSGSGSGVVRISAGAADADSSGLGSRADCTYTLRLPFKQTLPPGC